MPGGDENGPGSPILDLDRALALAAQLADEELVRSNAAAGETRRRERPAIAVNEAEPRHGRALVLEESTSGTETTGLEWPALLAFVRLPTKVGLFPRPMSVEVIFGIIPH